MQYLISLALGYLLGSIPTAYLLLKIKKDIDITKSGSGNVGAMNTYDVSNSKLLAIVVLFIDALKGFLSVYIILKLYPDNFTTAAIALIFAIFSHCFNPWINFKGGRGLATAAGGALFIFPFSLVVWLVLWVLFYLFRKDILIANIAATVFDLFLILSKADIAIKYSFPRPENISVLVLFSITFLVIIFIKHIDPLKEILSTIKREK